MDITRLSRIEKAIGNTAWMGIMPTQVMAMEPLFSYHSPLVSSRAKGIHKNTIQILQLLGKHQNSRKGRSKSAYKKEVV
ncbi:hypothetical protein H5410_003957 [Solanum commersonii]|uniref:Uncharacterized protein n=1 Tax=Solanum commersonii TaxID=4109 RepID=A0A9J6B6F4_SOLCO|nr:hypothetical protein H5410_003957 [Solanum commersonii]